MATTEPIKHCTQAKLMWQGFSRVLELQTVPPQYLDVRLIDRVTSFHLAAVEPLAIPNATWRFKLHHYSYDMYPEEGEIAYTAEYIPEFEPWEIIQPKEGHKS